MKICIFIRTLLSGGAEKQSMLLAKTLQDSYEVHLIVQKGQYIENKHLKFIKENDINLILLKGCLYKRIFEFYRILKNGKFDLIFSYLTSDNFWSAIIGEIAGVRYIIGSIRNERLAWIKYLISKQIHLYLQDYTIFNNNSGYQHFIDAGFKKGKSIIIHNCIDITTSPINRPETKSLKILTVARFTEQKDYLTAIKSFHYFIVNLCPGSLQVEYLIVGYGILEPQIKQWIEERNLSKNVKMVINPDNVDKYYLNSHIYFSTSVFEGLSNSIMEAMSFSLPVIATDVGDNRELIIDNKTGYLVPVKEYQILAGKIAELISSHKKRIAFGKAGYYLLKEKCSLRKFQNNYLGLIQSLK